MADGVGIVTENLFSGRFRYVDELRRMGADIRTEGHHAVVRGVPRLSGAPVRAPDIRAGAALVLAGLVAEGETVVSGAAHVDRGYEDLAGRLALARGRRGDAGDDGDRRRRARRPVDPASRPAPGATGWRWPGCSRSVERRRRARPGRWPRLGLPRSAAAVHGRAHRRARGAGKSTLVDRLITAARGRLPPRRRNRRASTRWRCWPSIPSSPFSGGAILGDRVRMQDHAIDPTVFIRSMATRGHLGGLALAVPEAVRVLGAVGLPLVLVETVGVGQMEVEVASATDTTVVVVTPGWGDSMQANKAGLLEVADIFVINKADRPGVREARRDLEQMLDLSAPGDWRPPIVETVATDRRGRRRAVGRGGRGTGPTWPRLGRAGGPAGAPASTEELRRVLAARLAERRGGARFGRRGDRLSPKRPVRRPVRGQAALDPYDRDGATRLLAVGRVRCTDGRWPGS